MPEPRHANRCDRCSQRILRPDASAPVPLKALQMRQGTLYLQCRCGTWNPAPARLYDRLRALLGLAPPP